MSRSSVLLLSDTSGKFNATGDAVRADGWYGLSGGVHTVAVHLQNLTGRVYIEGSLANEPTEIDWFPIYLTASAPYVDYPRNPARPSLTAPPPPPPSYWPSYPPPGHGPYGDSGVEAFVFQANLMWIRARLDRTHLVLGEPPTDVTLVANYGVVKQILLNH